MQPFLLPLFPLGVVLFPDATLPLHIFEERYKEMIGEAIQRKEEFGIVLTGKKGVANVGCTATIEEVIQKYPDGRMDIITVGRRRFEISSLNEERAFLRAQASFFDDHNDELSPLLLREKVIGLVRSFTADPLDLHSARLSFDIAQHLDDLEFKQIILSLRAETERLEYIVQHLPSYIERRHLVDQIRYLSPRNGYSKHFRGDFLT